MSGLVLLVFAGITNERIKVWNNMEALRADVQHVTQRHLSENAEEIFISQTCPNISVQNEFMEIDISEEQ